MCFATGAITWLHAVGSYLVARFRRYLTTRRLFHNLSESRTHSCEYVAQMKGSLLHSGSPNTVESRKRDADELKCHGCTIHTKNNLHTQFLVRVGQESRKDDEHLVSSVAQATTCHLLLPLAQKRSNHIVGCLNGQYAAVTCAVT